MSLNNSTYIIKISRLTVLFCLALLLGASQVKANSLKEHNAVLAPLVSGTVTPPSQTVEYNGVSSTMICSAATGGNGTYAYQWQLSTDNVTFTDISGVTGLNYSPSYGHTLTLYYRVASTSAGVTVFSNSSAVYIKALTSGTVTPSVQYVNYNSASGTMTGTPATGWNGTYTYHWQLSTDNSTFTDISGGPTTLSYTPAYGHTFTLYYRLVSTSAGINVFSNSVAVYVNACGDLTNNNKTSNFIQTSIPRAAGFVPLSAGPCNTNVMRTVQYFDGLGRPLQTTQIGATQLGKDLVQPFVYDVFGREATKYLPYAAATNDGSFHTDALTSGAGVQQFYYPTGSGASGTQQSNGIVVDPHPYAQTVFESSPLSRPIEQGAPGDAWQPTNADPNLNHTVRIGYNTNDLTDITTIASTFKVMAYDVAIAADGTRTLTNAGTNAYPVNTLYVTTTKDEDWKSTDLRAGTVQEFKDNEGRVVLKRAFNKNPDNSISMLSTYYVYDALGNLCYVLPPNALPDGGTISAGALANLCYQYRYDSRNRLVEKIIPGKGLESTVYNSLNQIVATQDANQQVNNQWIFTKYDAQGRSLWTGTWTGGATSSRVAVQAAASAFVGPLWETRATGGYPSNTAWPTSGFINTLTVNYYDDYTFGDFASFPAGYDRRSSSSSFTTGLLTCTKTFVFNTSAVLYKVFYYDDFGRQTSVVSQHYLNGTTGSADLNNYDLITNSYDFTNDVTATTLKHFTSASTATPAVTVANTYTFDQVGRKKQTTQAIATGATTLPTPIILSQLDYNEIGQLKTKSLHSENSGSSYLQTANYLYNERGWLSQVNDPSVTLGVTQMFAMKLGYNSGTSILYNGNISNQVWRSYGQAASTTFNYTYDKLNRLISGATTGGTFSMAESGITYDDAGNIKTLTRDANAPYVYTNITGTNQLQSVTGLTTGSYVYDPNGNMKTDARNGTSLTYNPLNLPSTIIKTGSINITYVYDASGRKLRKISGTNVNDYIDGIQYDNSAGGANAIDFIQTEEGRAYKRTDGTYSYYYDLTDHLGNARVTFNKNPTTLQAALIQANDYYPFGMTHATTAGTNNYLYNKKELQSELGQYDYGARFYDPFIGRWTTPDPLGEFTRRQSLYNYALNNPVRFVDPTGMAAADTTYNGGALNQVNITATKTNNAASTVGNFLWAAVDYIPFAGSVKQIGVGIYHGSWSEVGLGVVALGVDAVTGGEGGEALRVAEVATEDLIKVAAEDELKEGAEKALEDAGVEVAEVHGNNTNSQKPTEAYTITDDNGKPYHGVGDTKGARANQSLKKLEKSHPDRKFKITDRKAFSNRKGALLEEHSRIKNSGALKIDNYNKINSPGAKL
ncbi:MAG: wapA 1 [Mucilaginibacter sp.]|nr:wapA 1 [Mucilaginibacter sp.]